MPTMAPTAPGRPRAPRDARGPPVPNREMLHSSDRFPLGRFQDLAFLQGEAQRSITSPRTPRRLCTDSPIERSRLVLAHQSQAGPPPCEGPITCSSSLAIARARVVEVWRQAMPVAPAGQGPPLALGQTRAEKLSTYYPDRAYRPSVPAPLARPT
jgi:hypothetical protein